MRAQMSALKMQLQPHFLFNTLNAIMVLVRQQDAARAEEMLGRLGDLLRCVLDEGEAQEVPLHRELDYVRLYLSIEEVRFEERLKVTITIDPTVLDGRYLTWRSSRSLRMLSGTESRGPPWQVRFRSAHQPPANRS